MVEQWWVDAARRALDRFRVLDFVDDDWKRITAEADTGSIYQAYAVPSRIEIDGGSWLVVVRHPWERMYEKSPGMFTTAEYFASKWGKPGVTSLDRIHGGDLYACMKTVSMLVPFTFPQPEEYLTRESA